MHAALRRMKCAPGNAPEVDMAWAKDRLSALGAAPLEALDGEVLLHSIFPS
jgi:hypothetical protein